jgi:hypothetical protein
MEDTAKNKPSKVFQCGPIKAAIWSDSKVKNNAVVEVHSINIDRSYRDGDEWRHTNSFNVEDLPKVAMVATEAYKFIRLRSAEKNKAGKIETDRD